MPDFWHPYCTRHVPPDHTGLTMLGGTRKAVAHKTQSNSEDPNALFGSTHYWPHFLIGADVAYQFIPVNLGSYSLANLTGGVETNRGGLYVVQLEIVGYDNQTMNARAADRFLAVAKWLRDVHGIPWTWPAGVPLSGARFPRDTHLWTGSDGWFAHSQIPENDHVDPEFTNLEWYVLGHGMAA